MSWTGTVQCGYCYGEGHNRRKCPLMEKQHDEYVVLKAKGATDSASWRQGRAFREWKEQQETLKESNKVCGYCEEPGHRVTTCPQRIGHVDNLRKLNKWWKKTVAKVFKETGFGLGALTQVKLWGTRDGKDQRIMVPHIILGIEDHAVDFCGLKEGFGNITVMNTQTMERRAARLPPDVAYALFKAAVDVDGVPMPTDTWGEEWRRHPICNGFKAFRPPSDSTDGCVMAPSDKTFHNYDSLFYPLEKKADINKMFRAKDKGRTKEHTGSWLVAVIPLLKKHKGVKL